MERPTRHRAARLERSDLPRLMCRSGPGPWAPGRRRVTFPHARQRRGFAASASGPKNERHECQHRSADGPGDLPASLGRKVDTARLEPVWPIAIGDRSAERQRRGVEPPARDHQGARDDPPPTELPTDRTIAFHGSRIRGNHAIQPQSANPQIGVSESQAGAKQPIADLGRGLAWLCYRAILCVGHG